MTADIADSRLVRELVAWKQDVDGDWCVICQARRNGDSELRRAIRLNLRLASDDSRHAATEAWTLQPLPQAEFRVLMAFMARWLLGTLLVAVVILIVMALLGLR